MRKSVSRGLRTALQAGLLEVVLQLLEAFGVPINGNQHAAIIGVGVVVLAVLLAEGEEATGKTVLEPAKVSNPADVVQPGG